MSSPTVDTAKYYVWVNKETDDSLAWIEQEPEEIYEKAYLLTHGVPVSEWFPRDVAFKISPGDGIKLADSIPNILGMLLVSEKLKGILERESNARFEFFPIRVKDKKGRVVKQPYFLANLLGSVSCLDKARSDFDMQTIIKDQVDRFRVLALDEQRIPKDARLFRLAEKTELILAREDLARSIIDQGCIGARFRLSTEFGSEFRA